MSISYRDALSQLRAQRQLDVAAYFVISIHEDNGTVLVADGTLGYSTGPTLNPSTQDELLSNQSSDIIYTRYRNAAQAGWEIEVLSTRLGIGLARKVQTEEARTPPALTINIGTGARTVRCSEMGNSLVGYGPGVSNPALSAAYAITFLQVTGRIN